MASPVAQGLFQRAIGEGAACLGTAPPMQTRAEAEKTGVRFADSAFGTASLPALRAEPAPELLVAATKQSVDAFLPDIDGYFLPARCPAIYREGKQSHVPLLAGWNEPDTDLRTSAEGTGLTVNNYRADLHAKFGRRAADIYKLYPATTNVQAAGGSESVGADSCILDQFRENGQSERRRLTPMASVR